MNLNFQWYANRISILLIIFGCAIYTPLCIAATMPSFQVKFIDADSKEPIVNGHVIFYAEAKEGTITGDGGSYNYLFFREGVTNNEGVVDFPAQFFWPSWMKRKSAPRMVIFKEGYKNLEFSGSQIRMDATTDEIISFANQYSNSIHSIKKALTTSEIFISLYELDHDLSYVYFRDEHCAWEKIPQFIMGFQKAVTAWNSLPKEKEWLEEVKKVQWIGSTIQPYQTVLNGPIKKLIASKTNGLELFFCVDPLKFFQSFGYSSESSDNKSVKPMRVEMAPVPSVQGMSVSAPMFNEVRMDGTVQKNMPPSQQK